MADSSPASTSLDLEAKADASGTSRHTLHVEAQDEWEFEHPAECPSIEVMEGVWDHDCLLGRLLRYEGFDAAEVAPGDYYAEAWATQSTESRTFGEWESGITLEAIDA